MQQDFMCKSSLRQVSLHDAPFDAMECDFLPDVIVIKMTITRKNKSEIACNWGYIRDIVCGNINARKKDTP
jgi:hypothetical protein